MVTSVVFRNALMVLVVGCMSVSAYGQKTAISSRHKVSAKARPVRIVAVGDINLAAGVGRVMQVKGIRYPFAPTRAMLRGADIAFGNLECSVAKCGTALPDKKFTFRADPKMTPALADAGFDVVSLANNHAWDYGRDALAETVNNVRGVGVLTVGAGANREAAHALTIVERNGLKIGFLAYLGMLPPLVPESDTLPSLAMASVEVIKEEVEAARDSVDILIVSLHAGKEMAPKPTARQKTFARAAIDAGADMVIGHHPHVVQEMETYRDKPICYSLGNFVFSVGGKGTGAMLDATLYPDRRIVAKLRPLVLAGVQPRFPSKAKRKTIPKSVDSLPR